MSVLNNRPSKFYYPWDKAPDFADCRLHAVDPKAVDYKRLTEDWRPQILKTAELNPT